MGRITSNAEAASALATIRAKSELLGPDGLPLGLFIPKELASLFVLAPDLYAEPTREELDRIEAAGGGIPHDEVVKRLGLE